MIIIKKENYLDILDSKQDFLIAKKDKKKKGFIYEFDFKTQTGNELSISEINELINTFSFFSKIGKNRDGVRFTVHFTKMASESLINFDSKYFKIMIGLTAKRTLSEVEENVLKLFSDSGFSDFVILNKRIVNNKNDVSVEEYLRTANMFIQNEFPEHYVQQITFEGKKDKYQVIDSSEVIIAPKSAIISDDSDAEYTVTN